MEFCCIKFNKRYGTGSILFNKSDRIVELIKTKKMILKLFFSLWIKAELGVPNVIALLGCVMLSAFIAMLKD
jgi:hypothetical protein